MENIYLNFGFRGIKKKRKFKYEKSYLFDLILEEVHIIIQHLFTTFSKKKFDLIIEHIFLCHSSS